MQKISYLHPRKDELDVRGESRTEKEEKELVKINNKLQTLRNTKIEILDEILFPAMADLTFFFQATSQFPVLHETFGKDILDLLGIRRFNPRAYNYAFMFIDLVGGMIAIDNKARTITDNNDFRLKLIHELQRLIILKLTPLKILDTTRSWVRVLEEISHSMVWIEMIASRVKDHYDLTKLSPRYDINEMKKREKNEHQQKKYMEKIDRQTLEDFKLYADKNAPSRSFDFDTAKMIQDFDAAKLLK